MLVLAACILLLLLLDTATGNIRLLDQRSLKKTYNSIANISWVASQQRRGLSDPEVRIFGGWDAGEDRYAYAQVSLESSVDGHQCGGSLVAPDMVLTAAHCAGSFDKVVIGKYNLYDPSDDSETFGVVRETVHPSYDDTTTRFDSMLVLLDGRSTLAQPVRVNSDSNVPVNGQTLTVVGWGYDQNWNLPAVLQETEITYTQNLECLNLQASNGATLKGNLYDDMMCAGDVGRDSCYGDSGSPLILTGDSAQNDVVVGLVSWGYECAGDLPGIYSRLSNGLINEFIEKTICQDSVEPPSFWACSRWTQSPSAFPSHQPSITQSEEPTPSPFPTEAPVEGEDTSSASPSTTLLREFFQGTNATQGPSGPESSRGMVIRLLSRYTTGFSIFALCFLT